MKLPPRFLASAFALVATLMNLSAADGPGLHFAGKEGPGKGKKIVFIGGDEEYRSEEALPMLAKILSQRHGFDATVLFSLDPEKGFIDPNQQKNIPGTEALAEHVNRAVMVKTNDGAPLSSQKSPGPIELARAMVWAAGSASVQRKRPKAAFAFGT